jgi:hypothetical protein
MSRARWGSGGQQLRGAQVRLGPVHLYLAVNLWEPDVFACLDELVRR